MFLPLSEAPVEPLYQTAIVETLEVATPKPPEPEVKELTLEEKIKTNHYKCDETRQYIRRDNAQCLDKPVQAVESVVSARTTNLPTQTKKATTQRPVASGGNTYAYGYCTHYVKEQLSWVPNGLGDAVNWINGLNSTANPKVGMVAWQGGWIANGYGHVAVVVGVDGDRVTVREKNFRGWNVISTRTVHVSEFTYLY